MNLRVVKLGGEIIICSYLHHLSLEALFCRVSWAFSSPSSDQSGLLDES
jgi:hypothetical protein